MYKNLRDETDETDEKDVNFYSPSWPVHRIHGVIGAIPVDNVGVHCRVHIRRWGSFFLQRLGVFHRTNLEIFGWDMAVVCFVRVAIVRFNALVFSARGSNRDESASEAE